MKLMLAVSLSFFVSACGAYTARKADSQIEIGMTGEQVREIMGKPNSVRTANLSCIQNKICQETWTYSGYGGRARITFGPDGRVSSY